MSFGFGLNLRLGFGGASAPAPIPVFPEPTHAYSVRKVVDSYSGNCMEVERTSDSTSQLIGFDGNGDLDIAAINTFCSGTTGKVKTWFDQAGSVNLTQSTQGNMPEIYFSGSVLVDNGKPAIEFVSTFAFYLDASSAFNYSQPNTIATVSRRNNGLTFTENTLFDGTTGARHRVANNTSGNLFINAGNSLANGAINSNQLLNNFLFNGSSSVIRTNGTQNASGDSGSESLGTFRLGMDKDLTGQFELFKVQEVLIYNSNQSANFTAIENNLNSYFSVY